MKGVIVSGASGMIGISLINYLLKKNLFVVALVRKCSIVKLSSIINSPNLDIISCDMDEYSKLDICYNDILFDTFFHLAWAGTFGLQRNDSKLQLSNITNTMDAIRLAYRAGCKSFVGVGSQAEYGIRNDSITESDPVNPLTGYGIAKYAAGKLGFLEAKKYGMNFYWTRLFSAYGPYGIKQSVLNYVIDSLRNGESPKLGSCNQIWNFIHVDDVSSALYFISRFGISGKNYNIASNKQRKLKDYIEVIHKMIAPDIPILFDSNKQGYNLIVKPTALMDDTGWKENVDFDAFFKKTLS